MYKYAVTVCLYCNIPTLYSYEPLRTPAYIEFTACMTQTTELSLVKIWTAHAFPHPGQEHSSCCPSSSLPIPIADPSEAMTNVAHASAKKTNVRLVHSCVRERRRKVCAFGLNFRAHLVISLCNLGECQRELSECLWKAAQEITRQHTGLLGLHILFQVRCLVRQATLPWSCPIEAPGSSPVLHEDGRPSSRTKPEGSLSISPRHDGGQGSWAWHMRRLRQNVCCKGLPQRRCRLFTCMFILFLYHCPTQTPKK